MVRFLRLIVCAMVIALVTAAWGSSAAWAQEEDIVRNLDVVYDVRSDGTVDVTYELDWDFGTTGRHGIDLRIVNKEMWDQDPLQEVIYDITDLQVSSPTGVPTDVDIYDNDVRGTLDLRIGDPAQELDVDRATYVVTYTLGGALRTFDGAPELYWDVTSSDFPSIENFTITVNGPSDIPQARCLKGSQECSVSVEGDQAVLSGSDAARYQTITVVAGFEPGSIENAEPNLQERELWRPALLEGETTVTVDADGVAHFEEHLSVLTTSDYPTIEWRFPERRGLSWFRDQLFTVSDPVVTNSQGNALPTTRGIGSEGGPNQRAEIEVDLTGQPDRIVELSVTYTVEGAVSSDENGNAVLVWPISTFDSRDHDVPTTELITWDLPGQIGTIDCRFRADIGDAGARCFIDDQLASDGTTGTFRRDAEDGSFPSQWVIIEFDGADMGIVEPTTTWSRSARSTLSAVVIMMGLVVSGGAGLLLGRVRFGEARDLRFDGVAPGATGSASRVTTARRSGPVPVRFEPPEATVAETGFVLSGRPLNRHLTASLVNMAANGAIEIETAPLALRQLDLERCTSSFERTVFRSLPDRSGSQWLTNSDKEKLGETLDRAFRSTRASSGLFRDDATTKSTRTFQVASCLVLPVIAVALLIAGLSTGWFVALLACSAALAAALIIQARLRPLALSARGTVIKEQAEGFRQYLRTAESHQLNFEAEQDIFRAYLPWAVLFNDVKRWSKTCQELAASGRIPQPDIGFIAGAASISDISSQISKISSSTTPSSSGGGSGSFGGSGGSSGFSGGASGGGGGGGTSASSW